MTNCSREIGSEFIRSHRFHAVMDRLAANRFVHPQRFALARGPLYPKRRVQGHEGRENRHDGISLQPLCTEYLATSSHFMDVTRGHRRRGVEGGREGGGWQLAGGYLTPGMPDMLGY